MRAPLTLANLCAGKLTSFSQSSFVAGLILASLVKSALVLAYVLLK